MYIYIYILYIYIYVYIYICINRYIFVNLFYNKQLTQCCRTPKTKIRSMSTHIDTHPPEKIEKHRKAPFPLRKCQMDVS